MGAIGEYRMLLREARLVRDQTERHSNLAVRALLMVLVEDLESEAEACLRCWE